MDKRVASPVKWLIVAVSIYGLVSLVFGAEPAFADSGYATWYGPGFQGNEMNNGDIFNMYDPTTTASNIFPLGTWVKVTNPDNGRSVIVQVRDTGAFRHAFDLSYAAFKAIADPAVMGISVVYHVVSGPNGDPKPPPRPAPPPAPVATASQPSTSGSAARRAGYTVQPGDTLVGIAAQFGLDVQSIATWNGLANPDLVPVGDTLRLSAPAGTAPPAKATAPTPPSGATYVVQPGDTLDAIANRYGTTGDRLATANGIADPNSIVPGQALKVPAAAGTAVKSARTYVVQVGDTLSSIANSFGVSLSSVTSVNHLDNPDLLQPGTTLSIPN